MADRHTLRVHQKRWEAEGITSITFVDPSGAELPGWHPGAHLAIHLPNGIVREYSLCSDPADRSSWTVAVLRTPDSRGGSSYVHEALAVGALIEVEGPRNNFTLEDDADDYVLVAGGIGITPILSMVRHLDAAGKPWRLLYAGRNRTRMAFLDEITGLDQDRVQIHIDDESAGAQLDLAAALGGAAGRSLVYACGPESLMTGCGEALADPTRLRIERFKAPEQPVPQGEDNAFDVVIASTGERIAVTPEATILDALIDEGIEMDSSCTEGICGTCEVGVLKGDIEHRDFVLSDSEQESGTTMLPCVSRCRSAELVLDL